MATSGPSSVLTAEFEPGIASIYEGEDKLYQVLQFMDETGSHWLAELLPKGSPRITPALLDSFTSQPLLKKFVLFSLKNSAVWGEMTYLNRFADERYVDTTKSAAGLGICHNTEAARLCAHSDAKSKKPIYRSDFR